MSTNETDEIFFQRGFERQEHVNEEPSRALFAAWQNSVIDQANPQEDRRYQLGMLRDIIESAAAAQGSPDRQEMVRAYGEIAEYLWFGNDNTPLPHALKRYLVPGDETPLLTFNFAVMDQADAARIATLLEPMGLKELAAYRQELYQNQAPHLFRPLVEALVTNTPGYRLLESFNLERHKWSERPLTPAERIIEERSAEETVRRHYGLDATVDLTRDYTTRTELARLVQRLDEATRFDRHTVAQTDSPTNRAIAFFKNLAREELDGGAVHGSHIKSIRTAHRTFRDPPGTNPLIKIEQPVTFATVRIETDQETVHHDTESFITWAQSGDYLSAPGQARLRAISTFLVAEALKVLLDTDGENTNYSELLQTLINRYTDELFNAYREFAADAATGRRFGDLATLLVMPTEYDEELESFFVTSAEWKNFSAQRVLSKKEYLQASRKTIAIIKKRPVDDATRRIIQYHRADPALEGFDEANANLLLAYKTIEEGLFPVALGYRPVGYNAERKIFGLQYTPEADPHAECFTRIPDEARLRLAGLYADIGLHELAMLVHGAQDITVSQLARDVSRTNRYILPRTTYVPHLPSDLRDYAEQVTDGRLHMQCVGSSHFLMISLNEVFGPRTAGIINGDTLPDTGRRISSVGHQQTIFTDPETKRLYILDATSSGVSMLELRHAISGFRDTARRFIGLNVLRQLIRTRTAPLAPHKPQTEQIREHTTPRPEEHRRILLEQNRDALIMQLRMINGRDGRPMPHDDLMEQTARLHPDDIVFRTLSTAIIATSEHADPQEAERVLRYIQSLKNCDDNSLLQRVDPNEYTRQPRLLNALEGALQLITMLNRGD